MLLQNSNNCGSIEIRTFNTEFRNAVTIIEDSENVYTAFLTIMHSHRKATDCMQLELQNGSEVEACIKYFETIWNLHENESDILLNSKNL